MKRTIALSAAVWLVFGAAALAAPTAAGRAQQDRQDQQHHGNGNHAGQFARRADAPAGRPANREARDTRTSARHAGARRPAPRLSPHSGRRIPERRYRAHFGPEHRFRIGTPVLIHGYSRFQYGGDSFGFVEPWPPAWQYTDNVYVAFVDNDYYLYNPVHPGVRVAISVVF